MEPQLNLKAEINRQNYKQRYISLPILYIDMYTYIKKITVMLC